MGVNENVFFRDATKLICSSLEIEIAMQRAVGFLKDFMPAHEMYLHLYDAGLGAIRTIAMATPFEGKKMDRITALPPEMRQRLERELPRILTLNRPEADPVFQFMIKYYGRPDTSALSCMLEVDGNKLGVLALLAEGKDRYTEEHTSLFSLLKDPFSIALSNTLTLMEVLRLKDLLADDNRYLHRELFRLSGDEVVGAEFGLKDVMTMVRQVAVLDSPVLLLGETGVGKDVIANTIHYSSTRRDGPFVKVNCGAIPETLLDSELFGHEKGAFTGALSQKRGRFERAHHGTLFLDEIGELPQHAQIRMLRAIQYKEIERVGGTASVSVDIRIIAATNRDLEEMVRAKTFREDLWFRLNVFPILIPPLRKRKEDIPALLHHVVQRKSRELGLSTPPPLARGVIDMLTAYHWPGNVRELENVVERALILSKGLPLTFKGLAEAGSIEGSPVALRDDDLLPLDVINYRHICRALEIAKGKVHGKGGAAELLGIKASTLRSRMKQLKVPYGRNSKGTSRDSLAR